MSDSDNDLIVYDAWRLVVGQRDDYNDRIVTVYKNGDLFESIAWNIRGPKPAGAAGWLATARRHLGRDVLPDCFWEACRPQACDGGWMFVAEVKS